MKRYHGMYGTPTYASYKAMLGRSYHGCTTSANHYKGRGILVCLRWLEPKGKGFKNFRADMGRRPEGMSLDRINNDGDYEPSNCRWATALVQGQNTRKTKLLEYRGKSQSLRQWAAELGITHASLTKRIHKGWPLDQVFATTKFNKWNRERRM